MLKLPGLGIVYCTNVRAGSRNDEISFYGLYVLHKRPLVLKLLQCRKLILSYDPMTDSSSSEDPRRKNQDLKTRTLRLSLRCS